ncbi:MAG: hypothetical protein L6R42_005597 [Xanthoria sp. 1 TBL-2021]|nr:MAG: hypothetical protein L6R42_005597 [Xanthoria sp. 1 TBL-2021]
MAAQSRLALRSSGRSSQGLDDLPATVIQRNPSPVNIRKRTSTNHDDGVKFTKRTRNDPDNILKPRNVKVYSRKQGANIEGPLTQVARDPPAQSTTILQQPSRPPQDRNKTLISATLESPSLELQTTTTANKLDKRSLRSHRGSCFKSELALYFADYDEVLNDEPKKPGNSPVIRAAVAAADRASEFLIPETRIHIVDEPSAPIAPAALPPLALKHGTTIAHPFSPSHDKVVNGNVQPNDRLESHHFRLNNAERLDFSSLERHSGHITEDPLTDQLYFKAHRRAERGEKQHRNREKESAQHEQSQLERILEELKGQAWLRTMGITGITDSDRKSYEPKRTIFIQRVTTLLDKFKAWKEEERRRKAERERSCTVDEEDVDEQDDSDRSVSPAGLGAIDEQIDANARAKRLKQRKSTAAGTNQSTIPRGARSQHVSLLPIPVEKPFTSFFAKPYQRESALSGHRRGRQRFAFGQQIPELQQKDFSLSADWLTRNVLAANARSRRAAKRDHKDD